MTVQVRLPAMLAEIAGSKSLDVEVERDSTLGQLLDSMSSTQPQVVRRIRDETGALRRFVNVYVDEEDVRALGGVETPLPDGAVVQVLPSVAGG